MTSADPPTEILGMVMLEYSKNPSRLGPADPLYTTTWKMTDLYFHFGKMFFMLNKLNAVDTQLGAVRVIAAQKEPKAMHPTAFEPTRVYVFKFVDDEEFNIHLAISKRTK